MKMLAHAKLTLSLEILERLESGYHRINAEMVSLSLADVISIKPARHKTQISIKGRYAEGLPTGQDNLVYRALNLAGKKAKVRIEKAIASGAGLGGGSSNAAAVLRWANWNDLQKAAGIGADVAFCLRGGRARVSGIGEVLEPLEYREAVYTLLTPPFGCLTAEVYSAFDELGGSKGSGGNDLEQAALAAYPELAVWRDKLAEISGKTPRLAGSGSTWFVEGAWRAEKYEEIFKSEKGKGQKAELVVAKTVPAYAQRN